MTTSSCDMEIASSTSSDSSCDTVIEQPRQPRVEEDLDPIPSWRRLYEQIRPPGMTADLALIVVERYLRNAAEAIATAEAENEVETETETETDNEDLEEMEVDSEEETRPCGLTKEEIRRLPCCQYRPHKHGEQSRECLICLVKFKPRLLLRRLPCLHLFHRLCLDRWLSENNTCPHCRYCAFPIDLDPEEISKLMSK